MTRRKRAIRFQFQPEIGPSRIGSTLRADCVGENIAVERAMTKMADNSWQLVHHTWNASRHRTEQQGDLVYGRSGFSGCLSHQ